MTYEEALAKLGLNPDIRLRQMFELGKLAENRACADVADKHMREIEGITFEVGDAIRERIDT